MWTRLRTCQQIFIFLFMGHNLRWYYTHLLLKERENWKLKKYTRVHIEIVLPDFYNRNPVCLFFSIWERHFCRIFWFGRGKKVKTRRRDAGPWKLLADVKIVVFNFQLLLTARTRVSISSIAYVLKPVSFEMISRYPDDIFSRYYLLFIQMRGRRFQQQ